MTLVISSLFVGAVLALRFKIMILLPAIIVTAVLVIARGVFHGDNLWWAILMAALAAICLQIGYLVAAYIRVAVIPARRSPVVTATLIQTRNPLVPNKRGG